MHNITLYLFVQFIVQVYCPKWDTHIKGLALKKRNKVLWEMHATCERKK